MRECPFSHSRPSYFVILKLLNNYISIEIRLSLVAFQLWRVLEQLAPESFCESPQSLVNLLTSTVFTFCRSFVRLHGDISIYLRRVMF